MRFKVIFLTFYKMILLFYRSSSCLVAMKDRLYALGGFNGQFLQSVEMYDPRVNSWEPVADMAMTRVHFGASVV